MATKKSKVKNCEIPWGNRSFILNVQKETAQETLAAFRFRAEMTSQLASLEAVINHAPVLKKQIKLLLNTKNVHLSKLFFS